MNLLGSEPNYPSTGELKQRDSVAIAIDDIRIVNSKLIELEYQKEINIKLKQVISNDSIIIQDYKLLNDNLDKDIKKLTLQRNIGVGVTILSVLVTTILLCK